MKRILFLFAFLFAIVAMKANVVPIDNDVGPPITMELNATIDIAVTQNVDFLFAEAQHIDKVIKIETEYTLCETDLSNSIAEVTYDGVFIKTYRGSLTKDQNSNYLKSYLRLNIKGLIEIALLDQSESYYITDLRLTMLDGFNTQDQNNTYFKSYLRQLSYA